jgi:hypothetical protein
MSQTAVENIVKVIESLSEEDRELLETRLAAIDEAKWQKEAEEARAIARDQGIDQAHIDGTINKLRYE